MTDQFKVLARLLTAAADVASRYDDTKLSVYAAAHHAIIVLLVDAFGHEKAYSIHSNVQWGEGEMWYDDLLAAIDASNEGPQYVHDCDRCTFIGRSSQGEDVYYCEAGTPGIVHRFGNEGAEYGSMPLSVIEMMNTQGCDSIYQELHTMYLTHKGGQKQAA